MKKDFDTLGYLWRILGNVLLGSFVVHGIAYNGNLRPSDDLWLWLSLTIGAMYTLGNIIHLIQNR